MSPLKSLKQVLFQKLSGLVPLKAQQEKHIKMTLWSLNKIYFKKYLVKYH